MKNGNRVAAGWRSLALLFVLAVVGFVLPQRALASSTELIPSVGLTRSVDSDEAKSLYGLALRSYIIPHALQGEIQGQYRQEDLYNGDLHLKTWPITASLYVSPIQQLYVGAGGGWYHNTFDYRDGLNIPNKTTEQFGVHVGGGMQLPLMPGAALDLNGRYVFLEDEHSELIPETFNPDFWSASLGLALKF
jgi:opacity protein-like surface antigen